MSIVLALNLLTKTHRMSRVSDPCHAAVMTIVVNGHPIGDFVLGQLCAFRDPQVGGSEGFSKGLCPLLLTFQGRDIFLIVDGLPGGLKLENPCLWPVRVRYLLY